MTVSAAAGWERPITGDRIEPEMKHPDYQLLTDAIF
jgi:hypothetical protein